MMIYCQETNNNNVSKDFEFLFEPSFNTIIPSIQQKSILKINENNSTLTTQYIGNTNLKWFLSGGNNINFIDIRVSYKGISQAMNFNIKVIGTITSVI